MNKPAKSPKRRISKNVWGNWVGYEGRARTQEFGDKEIVAEYWLRTGDTCELNAYSPESLAAAQARPLSKREIKEAAIDAEWHSTFEAASKIKHPN